MSALAKIFTYQVEGLSYTVTVYEENGQFFADITVDQGSMDVNAVYFGDDDMSGASAALRGPLNMNGAGATYEGDPVQWDDAVKLSDPGLGRIGTDKATFLESGETLTVELDIDSLDEVDVFGIRATSTSTPSGSIKAVSGDPEVVEEPDDPTYDKVFFGYEFDDDDNPLGGYFIEADAPDPNPYSIPSLPAGTEPTFDNYVEYFQQIGGDVGQVESVVFYEDDADGIAREAFRVDAPDEGFADAEALLAAYDDALAAMEAEGVATDDLMLALALPANAAADMPLDDEDDAPDAEVDL